jgi:WD40 repeat protein
VTEQPAKPKTVSLPPGTLGRVIREAVTKGAAVMAEAATDAAAKRAAEVARSSRRSPHDTVLVVDFGTAFTKAKLFVPGDAEPRLVTDPLKGDSRWPSCIYLGPDRVEVGEQADARRLENAKYTKRTFTEFKRHLGTKSTFGPDDQPRAAWELACELLKAIKVRAQQLVTQPVDRLLITCPGDFKIGIARDSRWADLDRACREAGFDDIEYLPEPVAAAYAPVSGSPFTAGQIVLVYDWGGGTFDAALVKIAPQLHQVLATGSVPFCGGADIDEMLVAEIRKLTGNPADTGKSRRNERLKSSARKIKELLGDADKWPVSAPDDEDDEDEDGEEHVITRERLDELVSGQQPGTGLIDKTFDLIKQLIEGAKLEPVTPDAVLAVGGTTAMQLVRRRLDELDYPVRQPVNQDYAVIDGAVAWARLGRYRQACPEDLILDEIPLRWPIPGDRHEATISTWLAQPGDTVRPGETIVRVALPDGALWDLKADRPGTLAAQHYRKDHRVRSADWLATIQPLLPGTTEATVLPRLWREIPGAVTVAALSADGRYVATANGVTVRAYDLVRWALVGTVKAEGTIEQLLFTPAGEIVATSGGTFTAWRQETLQRRWSHKDGRNGARMAASPDGKFLAISSPQDARVLVASAKDRSILDTVNLDHSYNFSAGHASTYSPDGKLLIPASNGAVGIKSASADTRLRIVSGHSFRVLAVRANDNWIYASAGNHKISTHRPEDWSAREVAATVDGYSVSTLAFNRSGTLLAAGLSSGNVDLRRVFADTLSASAGTVRTGADCIFTAFTPDGYYLITANSVGLAIWSLADTILPVAASAR